MRDLSVTTDVNGVELTSLDVDPKMAFDVAYHGLAAGHATRGLHVVTPGLLGWFFFDLFSCSSMGFLGFLGLGSSSSASNDVWESKSSLLLRWGGGAGTSLPTTDIMGARLSMVQVVVIDGNSCR